MVLLSRRQARATGVGAVRDDARCSNPGAIEAASVPPAPADTNGDGGVEAASIRSGRGLGGMEERETITAI